MCVSFVFFLGSDLLMLLLCPKPPEMLYPTPFHFSHVSLPLASQRVGGSELY